MDFVNSLKDGFFSFRFFVEDVFFGGYSKGQQSTYSSLDGGLS